MVENMNMKRDDKGCGVASISNEAIENPLAAENQAVKYRAMRCATIRPVGRPMFVVAGSAI